MMEQIIILSLISLFCLADSANFTTPGLKLSATQLDCFDMDIMCREDYTTVCHDDITLKAQAIGDTLKEGEDILAFLSSLPNFVGKHCSHQHKRSIKEGFKSFFLKLASKFTKTSLCRVIAKVNELLKSSAPGRKAACALDIIQTFLCSSEMDSFPESEFVDKYVVLSDRLTMRGKEDVAVNSPEFQKLLSSYLQASNVDSPAANSGHLIKGGLSTIIVLFVSFATVMLH